MEQFTKARLCPQCEGTAMFAYHENRPESAPVCTVFQTPHMHRTCISCDYQWSETPLV